MEQSPASRFIDVLGRLGYKTQQQIADLLQIARPTAGTIVRQERDPGFADVVRLKEKHDEVNIDYIFTGKGSPFERNLTPLPASPQPAAALMSLNTEPDEMSDAERAEYYKLYYERTKQKLALAEQTIVQLTEAQEHAEVVQLVARTGGRSFTNASPEAAEDAQEPRTPMTVWSNPDYAAAEEPERRLIGFGR